GWSNVQIFNQNGDVLLFFGGRGPIPGMLRNPTAIAIDGRNHIYVADFVNHRVNEYRLVNTTAADSYSATQSEAHSGIGMTLRWAAQLHQLRAAKTNRASLNTVVETAPADGIKLRLDREFNHDAKLL
ncbi:MAG: hypothetical protein OES99_12545, partial [Gammaproteobacteria bacterium]|nr:hypothetical protein [Gammaproteobacteria bacterium]